MQPFVDIHCHLIPGIDDGAADWDATLAMARIAVDDGIGTVICTPHQLGGFAHNLGDEIRQRTQQLQTQLRRHNIPLIVLPGGDVRIEPDMVKHLRSGQVLTLADRRRHVLLELPHELYFPIDDLLVQLERQQMQGILSHPERNQGLLQNRELVARLVERGCLMQVTAGSLHGSFGPESEKMSVWMLERGLVHFVATDAHGPKSRRPLMRRAYDAVCEIADEATARRICCEFPAAVAAGRAVRPPAPTKPSRSFSWLPWRRAS